MFGVTTELLAVVEPIMSSLKAISRGYFSSNFQAWISCISMLVTFLRTDEAGKAVSQLLQQNL